MRSRRGITLLTAGALAIVFLAPLAALADDDGAAVSAIDNIFAPQIVRIEPGQTVDWTIEGRSAHTVTADDGSQGFGRPATRRQLRAHVR
jgi:plastocyanin